MLGVTGQRALSLKAFGEAPDYRDGPGGLHSRKRTRPNLTRGMLMAVVKAATPSIIGQ
ncbi:hypothetical protein pRALTA_0022 (plasmid) [Cupriavidus taiwanensis LMG 19424]|uniref:Uncharacterized protein n=2 Tax=Cupriavidus TaxID=106589 RepID=B2AJQ0_CUPTR|nr:hypothetical protein pRALTA_0022 [Cupriavidus taiwanensis LMG 19424]SOY75749.1 hypothetical protein CBM2585_P30012 [Cupriavidus taiwanensis]SOZ40582.1 hypothetical protein CBM2605_P30012 [Cupriavidus neocaledonicus]SOY99920.1 hypothetical protein CBM2591_P30012 [Cupriavidus taiwanensis]SOZ20369.1 hypothetical protein CBM2595_P30011 [Cupriavidus taiwanensis]